MITLSTQFVDVAGRRVLVRYAGSGPAVVLLHQSPQNSRAMIPWIERLSEQYSVFAPDTPGFGSSDPLPLIQPSIEDMARAVKQLLDALGIKRAIVYGVHTGAVTALRLSLDYPERIAGLVCDGYARFNTDERQKLLDGYLPPFEPEWNGGHLLWLWSRFREQNLYFPWNTPTMAARLRYPAPTTEKLHADVLDLLDAGDGYRLGYRAAFLYDDPTAASRLNVPTRIFYREEDVLAAHLPRLQNLPSNVIAELVKGGQSALVARTDAFIAEVAEHASRADSVTAVAAAVSQSRRVMPTPHGSLGMLISMNGGSLNASPVEVHLHDLGFPAKIPVGVPHGTVVIAPELPGHGASRPWAAEAVAPQAIADAILAALELLGVGRFSISAEGAACAVAAQMVAPLARASDRAASRCQRLRLINPLPLNASEREQFLSQLPDATPHRTGAHLLDAWNWARMKHLFWPWLPPAAAAARMIDAPAPVRLHTETLEIVRVAALYAPLWRALLAADLALALADFGGELEVVVSEEGERARLVAPLINSLGLVRTKNLNSVTISGEVTWLKHK